MPEKPIVQIWRSFGLFPNQVTAPTEPSVPADSSCATVTGSESLGFHRKCEDRNHHWWPKADAVAVDIYDDGEVVVIVRVGEKDIILECGAGSQNAGDEQQPGGVA